MQQLSPRAAHTHTPTWQVLNEMKDLNDNHYAHTLNLFNPMSVAVVIFVMCCVDEPPPELFFSNPLLYVSLVQNAGGVVLLQFLVQVGLPNIEWMQSMRTPEEPSIFDHLHVWALHKFRTAHKTKSQIISLNHLVSVYGTHPKLRQWIQVRVAGRRRTPCSEHTIRAPATHTPCTPRATLLRCAPTLGSGSMGR